VQVKSDPIATIHAPGIWHTPCQRHAYTTNQCAITTTVAVADAIIRWNRCPSAISRVGGRPSGPWSQTIERPPASKKARDSRRARNTVERFPTCPSHTKHASQNAIV